MYEFKFDFLTFIFLRRGSFPRAHAPSRGSACGRASGTRTASCLARTARRPPCPSHYPRPGYRRQFASNFHWENSTKTPILTMHWYAPLNLPEWLTLLRQLPGFRSRGWSSRSGWSVSGYRDPAGAGAWCYTGGFGPGSGNPQALYK